MNECKVTYGPFQIAKFEDTSIKSMATGTNYSFVYSDSPKEITEMCMHKIDETHYEEGILHFYNDANGKLVIVPPSQYLQKSSSLPDICFAIKYPIKKLEEKKLPDLKSLF